MTPVTRLQEDSVESLLWHDGRLWIGTGVDGKLFRVRGEGKGEVVWDGDDTHLPSDSPSCSFTRG